MSEDNCYNTEIKIQCGGNSGKAVTTSTWGRDEELPVKLEATFDQGLSGRSGCSHMGGGTLQMQGTAEPKLGGRASTVQAQGAMCE